MSSGARHTQVGVLVGVGCAMAFLAREGFEASAKSAVQAGLLVLAAAAAALLPDIDTKSRGQMIFYTILLVADVLLIFLDGKAVIGRGAFDGHRYAAYMGCLAMIPVISNHRGWTHRISTALVVSALVWFFAFKVYGGGEAPLFLGGAVLAGYMSHLALDREMSL